MGCSCTEALRQLCASIRLAQCSLCAARIADHSMSWSKWCAWLECTSCVANRAELGSSKHFTFNRSSCGKMRAACCKLRSWPPSSVTASVLTSHVKGAVSHACHAPRVAEVVSAGARRCIVTKGRLRAGARHCGSSPAVAGRSTGSCVRLALAAHLTVLAAELFVRLLVEPLAWQTPKRVMHAGCPPPRTNPPEVWRRWHEQASAVTHGGAALHYWKVYCGSLAWSGSCDGVGCSTDRASV